MMTMLPITEMDEDKRDFSVAVTSPERSDSIRNALIRNGAFRLRYVAFRI